MEHPKQIISVVKQPNGGTELAFTDDGSEVYQQIIASDDPVISFVGACNTRKSQLANKTMGTSFMLRQNGHGTEGVFVQKSDGIIALDFQGSNAAAEDALNADHQLYLTAFALSDLCVLNLYANNLETNYGEDLLKDIFKRLRHFQQTNHARRSLHLLVVLHDYDKGDPGVVTDADQAALKRRYEALWACAAEAEDAGAGVGFDDWIKLAIKGVRPYDLNQLANEDIYSHIKEHIGGVDKAGFNHCRGEGRLTAHRAFDGVTPEHFLGRVNVFDADYITSRYVAATAFESNVEWFRKQLRKEETCLDHFAETTQADAVQCFDDGTKDISKALRDEFRNRLELKLQVIAEALCKALPDLATKLHSAILAAKEKWRPHLSKSKENEDEAAAERRMEDLKANLKKLFETFCNDCKLPDHVERDAVRAHLRLSSPLPEHTEMVIDIAKLVFFCAFKRSRKGRVTFKTLWFQLRKLTTKTRVKSIVDQAISDTRDILKVYEESHILPNGTSSAFNDRNIVKAQRTVDIIRNAVQAPWSWLKRAKKATRDLIAAVKSMWKVWTWPMAV
ncbi:hypothetical protein J8273_6141 [Carpediemonas membranifera]|uniref:GB1/RHD3-type G domain-containing protein n=1 Tax=Carpediemonas membranifera TaxID=201153 RepID=A0A8J6AQG5_9EUKA|nr:hypothetical protein J8273_6141 [Carpediemonas membranifera]|eukprot:KAG9391381.1 hypothetical protein J8273_6141 [Carpediemonas membranifera]